MNRYIIILLVVLGIQEVFAQNIDLTLKQNLDSMNLWGFSFSMDSVNNERIGTLTLRRNRDVYSNDNTKKITPQITFDIYPISLADSISQLESERIMLLSCCYPKCGATIKTTKYFVLWSSPWSITSALNCNGVDYTRKNAELILDKVMNQNFDSIDELISELPIERIKN